MRNKLFLSTAVCALCAAMAAQAQTTPNAPATPAAQPAPRTPPARPAAATTTAPASTPPATAPAPAPSDTVSAVSVTAQRAPVTTSVDSRSYTVSGTVNAATGSLADVLRTLPSVGVDLEGNLTLRGDGGVQIKVDGQNSPLFDSPARAQLLLSMPAKDVDHIEISTTPNATNSPEGTAGIINIVMKKQSASQISTGQVALTAATMKTGTLTGNYSRKFNNLTLAANGLLVHQEAKQIVEGTDSTGPDPATAFNTTSNRQMNARVDVGQIGLNADYNAGPNHLVGSFTGTQQVVNQPSALTQFSTQGSPALSVVQPEQYRNGVNVGAATLDWTHRFSGEMHDLDGYLSYARTGYGGDTNRETNQTAPSVSDSFLMDHYRQLNRIGSGHLIYRQQTFDKGLLTLGAERTHTDARFNTEVTTGPSVTSQTRDPNLSPIYHLDQNVDAIYSTWQGPIGKLTFQPGLRIERVDRIVTSPGLAPPEYDRTSFYPTVNFLYSFNGSSSLRGGYSRRVNRPIPRQLQVTRSESGANSFNIGNPLLEPEKIDDYELGYQYRAGTAYRSANLYWRQSKDEISQVSSALGNGTTLSTWTNLGSSRSVGLELAATGPVGDKLTYNVSGNLMWRSVDPQIPGLAKVPSTFTLTASASLNWTPDPKDTLQLNGVAQPKQVTAQGYASAYQVLNLGWRRKLTDKVNLTFSARDLFNQVKLTQVVRTANYRSTTTYDPISRGASLQLSYTFGQTRPAPPVFDYSGGQATTN